MEPAEARVLRESLGESQSAVAECITVVFPYRHLSGEHLNKETIGRYERGTQPIPEWYPLVLQYFIDHGLQPVTVTFSPLITPDESSRAFRVLTPDPDPINW